MGRGRNLCAWVDIMDWCRQGFPTAGLRAEGHGPYRRQSGALYTDDQLSHYLGQLKKLKLLVKSEIGSDPLVGSRYVLTRRGHEWLRTVLKLSGGSAEITEVKGVENPWKSSAIPSTPAPLPQGGPGRCVGLENINATYEVLNLGDLLDERRWPEKVPMGPKGDPHWYAYRLAMGDGPARFFVQRNGESSITVRWRILDPMSPADLVRRAENEAQNNRSWLEKSFECRLGAPRFARNKRTGKMMWKFIFRGDPVAQEFARNGIKPRTENAAIDDTPNRGDLHYHEMEVAAKYEDLPADLLKVEGRMNRVEEILATGVRDELGKLAREVGGTNERLERLATGLEQLAAELRGAKEKPPTTMKAPPDKKEGFG